jgi:peptidoglycan/xylan/chitin deacetylase (PgdA/CDA1 family)
MLIKASAVGHAAAVVAVAVQPQTWPWALGALGLNHALITGTGLWPRSTWLGQNIRRLPEASAARCEVSLTIDDGPDPEVTPAVLDLLEASDARATFFCIARQAEQHPELCREIVRRGHSVQNHSHRHSHAFSLWGPKAMARDIATAQDRLSQITGEQPRFFRAPAGLRNPFLDKVLHEQGLQLVSWTRRGFDTARGNSEQVLARLTQGLRAGDILLLHDGNAAPTKAGRAVILDVLPALLHAFEQARLLPVTLPQALPLGAALASTRTSNGAPV